MQELNKEILILLNSLTKYSFIENIALYFSDLPIFFLPLFLTISWIYFSYKNNIDKKNDLLYIFYWTIIAISINLIVQNFITLERPETALEWIWKLILNHVPDASFPSDHAAVSVSFLVWLFFSKYKKIWYCFLIPVIIMNLSRVILWVHWPFDILWWSIVWIVSSIISFKILKTNNTIIKINDFIIKTFKKIKL